MKSVLKLTTLQALLLIGHEAMAEDDGGMLNRIATFQLKCDLKIEGKDLLMNDECDLIVTTADDKHASVRINATPMCALPKAGPIHQPQKPSIATQQHQQIHHAKSTPAHRGHQQQQKIPSQKQNMPPAQPITVPAENPVIAPAADFGPEARIAPSRYFGSDTESQDEDGVMVDSNPVERGQNQPTATSGPLPQNGAGNQDDLATTEQPEQNTRVLKLKEPPSQ